MNAQKADIACSCAASLIQTNSHEDGCAITQERWNDPEYVALWESRHPPTQPAADPNDHTKDQS